MAALQKANHRSAGFQAGDRTVLPGVMKKHGRIVTRVNVVESALGRIILAIKESRVPIRSGGLVHQAINAAHSGRQVLRSTRSFAAQRRLQAGHHQGCGNSFAGDIADRYAKVSLGQSKKVVVVATDTQRGPAVTGVIEARR